MDHLERGYVFQILVSLVFRQYLLHHALVERGVFEIHCLVVVAPSDQRQLDLILLLNLDHWLESISGELLIVISSFFHL